MKFYQNMPYMYILKVKKFWVCAYLRLDSIKENIEGDANLHPPPPPVIGLRQSTTRICKGPVIERKSALEVNDSTLGRGNIRITWLKSLNRVCHIKSPTTLIAYWSLSSNDINISMRKTNYSCHCVSINRHF